MNNHALAAQQFTKMLTNLAVVLDKGAAYADSKKFEMSVLLNSRLAPDQFNLLKQIQVACDVAVRTSARLTGRELPVFEDNEATFSDVKKRIENSVKYIQGFKSSDFEGFETRRISQPRWEGKTLSGEEFLFQWAIPNLYFHVTTAYAILRHNGVDIGKKDFLGQLPFQA